MPFVEECASGMEQSANDAAVLGAPIKLREEECAGGMVQNLKDLAL